jgi:hypothetical protein
MPRTANMTHRTAAGVGVGVGGGVGVGVGLRALGFIFLPEGLGVISTPGLAEAAEDLLHVRERPVEPNQDIARLGARARIDDAGRRRDRSLESTWVSAVPAWKVNPQPARTRSDQPRRLGGRRGAQRLLATWLARAIMDGAGLGDDVLDLLADPAEDLPQDARSVREHALHELLGALLG